MNYLLDRIQSYAPTTSLFFSIFFFPLIITFRFARFIVNGLDEMSMGLLYLTTVIFYIYNYWRLVTTYIKIMLNSVLIGKKVIEKVKNKKKDKKEENKEDDVEMKQTNSESPERIKSD